jgi:hypothetical protein
MLRAAALATLATLAAACGPGDLGPDAGSEDVDASTAMGGLVFQFSAPDVDQQLDEVLFTRLRLRMTNLRANGDAGPSLDTYLDERDLDLKDPVVHEVRFDRAAPGRYSAFEFGLERHSDMEAAWELEGEIELDGDDLRLEVEDEQTSSISLPLDLDLAPGETVEIAITVDLPSLAEAIEWDDVPLSGGDLVIDGDEPLLLAAMRFALVSSFEIASITPIR